MIKVLLTTLPDHAKSQEVAEILVTERLAACVNIMPGLTSIYTWKGAIEQSAECLLLVKTSDAVLPGLIQRLLSLHPYEVPEIVVLDPAFIHEPYARWITESVHSG